MTALGDDVPNAVGLVYIAGFGLDEGESIGGLLEQVPPTPAIAHLDIDDQGFAWLPEDDFLSDNHGGGDESLAMVSHPDEVVTIIETAATAVPIPT